MMLLVYLLILVEQEFLESHIDFLIKEKGYHPVIVKAYKQFLKEQSETIFPYLLNKSGDKLTLSLRLGRVGKVRRV